MATITQTVEKKTRTNVALTSADIIKMFMDAHPELAGQSAEIYIKSDYRLELHGDSYQDMNDMTVTIITEKVETGRG